MQLISSPIKSIWIYLYLYPLSIKSIPNYYSIKSIKSLSQPSGYGRQIDPEVCPPPTEWQSDGFQAWLLATEPEKKDVHQVGGWVQQFQNILTMCWLDRLYFQLFSWCSNKSLLPASSEVAKKPRKGVKVPSKGKMVPGKSMTLSGFGTISLSPKNTTELEPTPTEAQPQGASQRRRKPTPSTFQFAAAGTDTLASNSWHAMSSGIMWNQHLWLLNIKFTSSCSYGRTSQHRSTTGSITRKQFKMLGSPRESMLHLNLANGCMAQDLNPKVAASIFPKIWSFEFLKQRT